MTDKTTIKNRRFFFFFFFFLIIGFRYFSKDFIKQPKKWITLWKCVNVLLLLSHTQTHTESSFNKWLCTAITHWILVDSSTSMSSQVKSMTMTFIFALSYLSIFYPPLLNVHTWSYTSGHFTWNLWNKPSARIMNFIWNDHSCKILFIIWRFKLDFISFEMKIIFSIRNRIVDTTLSMTLRLHIAVIQWITSCHKNRMATSVITHWREHVTSLTTSVSTIRFFFVFFFVKLKFIMKAIKPYFKGSYDKQNLTLMVILYEIYETRQSSFH